MLKLLKATLLFFPTLINLSNALPEPVKFTGYFTDPDDNYSLNYIYGSSANQYLVKSTKKEIEDDLQQIGYVIMPDTSNLELDSYMWGQDCTPNIKIYNAMGSSRNMTDKMLTLKSNWENKYSCKAGDPYVLIGVFSSIAGLLALIVICSLISDYCKNKIPQKNNSLLLDFKSSSGSFSSSKSTLTFDIEPHKLKERSYV